MDVQLGWRRGNGVLFAIGVVILLGFIIFGDPEITGPSWIPGL
jgi:hypothetical protein